jgi:hypothetical protein
MNQKGKHEKTDRIQSSQNLRKDVLDCGERMSGEGIEGRKMTSRRIGCGLKDLLERDI